jgi:hypothetical protein
MKLTTSTFNVQAKSVIAVLLLSVSGVLAATPKPIPTPRQPRVANTAVQLRIGGVPSDSVICFEMKLSSVVATNANGTTVQLLSSPVAVEIMHWAGDSETVALSNLPQGQYSQIAITAKAAKATSLDPVSGMLVTKTLANSYSTTFRYSPKLTVSRTPIILNLQVSPGSVVNASVLGSNAGGNSAQMFRIATHQINTIGVQKPENGRIQRIVGVVTSSSNGTMTVQNGQTGTSLTFQIDQNAQFQSATRSTLNGMIVAVRGQSGTNGNLVATDIEALENQHGSVVDGVISGLIPNSPSMTLALQDGSGSGLKNSLVGSGVSMDPSENPNFTVDTHGIDMTGMASLTFDSNSLVLGQHVQLQSMRGMQHGGNGNAAAVLPETVVLEPQSLIGTVSNYQAGTTPGTFSFDLVFATNASMNVINPFFYTMHVYQQRGTDMHVSAGIRNGSKVQVWGLVFYSQLPKGSAAIIRAAGRGAHRFLGRMEESPSFIMVAGRIASK